MLAGFPGRNPINILFPILIVIGAEAYFKLRSFIPIASPQKKRVFLLCLDGASWRVLNPLIEKGVLPNFKKLKEGGAHGVLWSQDPMCSPALWTTIATGKSRDSHRITDFLQDGVPVTSNVRRVKAVWNILKSLKHADRVESVVRDKASAKKLREALKRSPLEKRDLDRLRIRLKSSYD